MSNHPLCGEEYIRKNTLLEWANDIKQGLIVEIEKYGIPNEQRAFAFQEFIDKINSYDHYRTNQGRD